MKQLLSAAILAIMASSAVADDLPTRKEFLVPPPPPPPMWTGFYVGLNAGGTWDNANGATTTAGPLINSPSIIRTRRGTLFYVGGPPPTVGQNAAFGASGVTPSSTNDGFIGGGQIGYNWLLAPSFLLGFETDIQGIAASNSTMSRFVTVPDPDPELANYGTVSTVTRVRRSLDYLGTARGRLGYLVMPTLLLYGTGGLAYGGINLSANYLTNNPGSGFGPGYTGTDLYGTSIGAGLVSQTRVGWTAGGGVEWMFMPNWSAKVEYLYYDLGTVTTPIDVASGFSNSGQLTYAYAARTSFHFNGNIVRAGVNYHFNWGAAPVVAKF